MTFIKNVNIWNDLWSIIEAEMLWQKVDFVYKRLSYIMTYYLNVNISWHENLWIECHIQCHLCKMTCLTSYSLFSFWEIRDLWLVKLKPPLLLEFSNIPLRFGRDWTRSHLFKYPGYFALRKLTCKLRLHDVVQRFVIVRHRQADKIRFCKIKWK